MNDDLNKIWDKIRKIIALKESATEIGEEGEAQAAAAALTRLLLKYDLSLEDIPSQEKQQNKICLRDIELTVPYENLSWYSELITVVARENSCQHLLGWKYRNHKRIRCHKLVGREKNIEVAMYLISFLSHRFIAAAKFKKKDILYAIVKKTGGLPSPQEYMKSFLLGCVAGLEIKIEKEKEDFRQEDITSLAIRVNEEINDFFIDNNYEVGKARKQTLKTLDPEAFREGHKTGRTVQVNEGITSDIQNKPYLK